MRRDRSLSSRAGNHDGHRVPIPKLDQMQDGKAAIRPSGEAIPSQGLGVSSTKQPVGLEFPLNLELRKQWIHRGLGRNLEEAWTFRPPWDRGVKMRSGFLVSSFGLRFREENPAEQRVLDGMESPNDWGGNLHGEKFWSQIRNPKHEIRNKSQ
jgi:hypothetical protein